MKQPKIQLAKNIITEPVDPRLASVQPAWSFGALSAVWKFTRLLEAAEVETIHEIDDLLRNSDDLTHLCGAHRRAQRKSIMVPGFKRDSKNFKAGIVRDFWGWLWAEEKFLKKHRQIKKYIEFVCENSAYKAGRSRRAYGIFLVMEGRATPWRTEEWYEKRKSESSIKPRTSGFHPFVASEPEREAALIAEVDKLVPKALPPESRADICQDMIVAVLTGEVTIANLRDSAGEYVKRFFRMFPPKYGHLSLDQPIRPDDGRTLGEMLAAKPDDVGVLEHCYQIGE